MTCLLCSLPVSAPALGTHCTRCNAPYLVCVSCAEKEPAIIRTQAVQIKAWVRHGEECGA